MSILRQVMPGMADEVYAANVGVDQWQRVAERVPDEMLGADFLRQYKGTIDSVTTVDPGKVYKVRTCLQHPIYEHARVLAFQRLLPLATSAQQCAELGALLYQAHTSYSECGLGSVGTDALVNRVKAAQDQGEPLYGAKITGGGSGGTVAILSDNSPRAAACVKDIAAEHARAFPGGGYLFTGSSPGAMESPVHKITR